MKTIKKMIWIKKADNGLKWIELKGKHVKLYYDNIEICTLESYYIYADGSLTAILWWDYNKIIDGEQKHL